MHRGISITVHVRARMYRYTDVPYIPHLPTTVTTTLFNFLYLDQDPVVQSIVSLTISLRHKFVKQISAKVTNTLLFFVEKM